MQARDSIVFVVPLKCLQHWKVWEQYGTTCARPFPRPFFVEPLDPQSKDAGLVLLSRDTMASDQFRAKTLRQRIRRHRSIFDVSCELMRFLGGLNNPPTSQPKTRRFIRPREEQFSTTTAKTTNCKPGGRLRLPRRRKEALALSHLGA